MILQVVPASPEHLGGAWSLYSAYVKDSLFSGLEGMRAPEDWDEGVEFSKFSETWGHSDQFVITVDGSPIGWIATSQAEGKLCIENFMVAPEWRGRKVAETILSNLSSQWNADGVTVFANILNNTEYTSIARKLAARAGLREIRSSNFSTLFQIN